MINEVVLEGIVVRDAWKFTSDLYFRLGVYRDSDLPAKKLDLERDACDYVNVRVYGGANGLIFIRRGMKLRVHGFFQSRDYHENLAEFIGKARKASRQEDITVELKGTDLKADQILIDRNTVEIVARRLFMLDSSTESANKTASVAKN